MTNDIKELIEKYETDGDFTHTPYDPAIVLAAEKMLGFNLDESYLAFIREYGHGGIGGIEIMGIGKNNVLISADVTMSYRDYGLSDNLFAVENCDEWIYCIDSTNGKIISWSDGDIIPAYGNFDAYLLDRFSDAAENLE